MFRTTILIKADETLRYPCDISNLMCTSFITEELDINFTVARMVTMTQKRTAHDHAYSIYPYGVCNSANGNESMS